MLQLKKSTGIRADRPCIRYGCTTCGTRALKGQGGLHPHICTNCKRNSAASGGRRPRSAHLRDISPDGWGQRHPRLHGSFIASWPARGWRNDAPTTMQPQGRLDNFQIVFLKKKIIFQGSTSDYYKAPGNSRYIHPASTRSTGAQRWAQGRAEPTRKPGSQPLNRRWCPTSPLDKVTAWHCSSRYRAAQW